MANLKEIRNRITSVGSTMQITSAMKMVSAAKLKKAQDAITAMRPYSEKLTELLQNLSATLDGEVGSKYSDYFTIGKKGNDILKKTGNVIENNNAIFDHLSYESTSKIAETLMELFAKSEYDKIVLVYNNFKNAATQIVMNEQFLPILPPKASETKVSTDHIFEPSKVKIVEELIPKSLKTQSFKALRDSVASEHGARMTAMHKATDNATELRDALKLQYNKARQAAITNEILEIVGGAEALAG